MCHLPYAIVCVSSTWADVEVPKVSILGPIALFGMPVAAGESKCGLTPTNLC